MFAKNNDYFRYIKRLYKRRGRPKGRVLIASIPRCGSTFLIRALGQFPFGSTCPKTRDCGFVRNLNELPNKKFIKTHSLAPKQLPKDVKVIFLFGDPIAAIISTYKKRFNKNHFLNCGYTLNREPDIWNFDELGYEAIFDSWMSNSKSYPVLAIRYETIFENKHIISKYLDTDFQLGKLTKRSTKINQNEMNKLIQVYGPLYEKVSKSPDAFILNP